MTPRPWCSCCGSEGRPTVTVCRGCVEALLRRYQCGVPGCDNVARYDSGLCGICDIKRNAGRGRLLRDLHEP